MTDNELDQLLDTWQAPAAPPSLRARVLAAFPKRQRRNLRLGLRWVLAITAASCVLAIGMEQKGPITLDNLATGVHHVHNEMIGWLDEVWIGHVLASFRGSELKIYVDGELQPQAEYGGGGATMWMRIPGDGKYYLTLSARSFEGPRPPVAGRFDGHVLEFRLGARAVRIESPGTYGFHTDRRVWAMGPVAGR